MKFFSFFMQTWKITWKHEKDQKARDLLGLNGLTCPCKVDAQGGKQSKPK
jgi:hypothetical protein